jgi:hypothetical protein
MKTFTNVTRYACDHCGKEYKVQRYVPKHEESCKKNPDNEIACIGCIFLKEVVKKVDVDCYNGYTTMEFKGFRCEKKDIGLFPPKVLHGTLLDRHPETFFEEELMPTKCDLHSFDDIFK